MALGFSSLKFSLENRKEDAPMASGVISPDSWNVVVFARSVAFPWLC